MALKHVKVLCVRILNKRWHGTWKMKCIVNRYIKLNQLKNDREIGWTFACILLWCHLDLRCCIWLGQQLAFTTHLPSSIPDFCWQHLWRTSYFRDHLWNVLLLQLRLRGLNRLHQMVTSFRPVSEGNGCYRRMANTCYRTMTGSKHMGCFGV